MKSAGKQQSEINEETYKTNVPDQDEPKTKKTVTNSSDHSSQKTLLTQINYARTEFKELITITYTKSHKTKETNYTKLTPNTKLKTRKNPNSGAYTTAAENRCN